MAIDTSIYGEPSSWVAVGNTAGHPDTNARVYMRQNPNISYDTTPIGEPIDKSVSVSGLGTESVFSRLQFFDINDAIETTGELPFVVNPTFTEVRSVTNWCFVSNNPVLQSTDWNQQNNAITDGDTTALNADPRIQRYAPEPVTAYENTANIRPFTQFSHKNLVICIYVTCTADFQTFHVYDLKTYKDTYSTTYPYITEVTGHLYSLDSGTEPTNTHPRRVLWINALNYCQVSILDRLQFPVVKPYMYGLSWTVNSGYFKIMGGFLLSATRANYNVNTSGHRVNEPKKYIGLCGTPKWKFYKHGSNGSDAPSEQLKLWGRIYREYDDTFYDECMTQTACFGMLFTDSENAALYSETTSDDMFCGVLDENLIGHGVYTHGRDNADNVQLNWTNSNDSTYDPSYEPPYDPNIYGIPSSFNAVSLADGALKRYALNESDMELLGQELWNVIDTTDPDALIQNQTLTNFLTNNPLDCIVSVKKFPLEDMGQSGTVNIQLGKVKLLNTSAEEFYSDSTVKTCGNKFVNRKFGDWRDFMCEYTLVLPFCGSVSLPAEIITGHWIEVKYSIDYTTGTCTAWVLCELDDGAMVVIDSASGNCTVDIPVSGIQTADLTAQIYNANENLKAQKFNNMIDGIKGGMSFAGSLTGAAKTGDISRGVTSGLSYGQQLVNSIHGQSVAEWNINHTQIPLKMIGACSGCNSFSHELTPRLIRYYPVKAPTDEKKYAHTVGYACCETAVIGTRSGYAEINNVELSGFTATATEKSMILSLLASGVYL